MIHNVPKTILRTACLSGLCAAFSLASLSGQVIDVEESTWIRSDNTSFNDDGDAIAIGGLAGPHALRALLRFDLSGETSATEATLKLTGRFNNPDGSFGPTTLDLFLLDTDFDRDTVSWLESSAGNTWTNPGGDFGATPLASAAINMGVFDADDPLEFQSAALLSAVEDALGGTLALIVRGPALETADARNIAWIQGPDMQGLPTLVIPEPSTYAAIFGGLALAGMLLRRRMRK